MRILYITTISGTMNAFFGPHIEMLVKAGHHVDIASNSTEFGVDKVFDQLGCTAYQIDFSRSPLSPDNIRAYGQLRKVIESGNYDIVHCHTPNASVITRLVCRKLRKKTGLKVFYTAHGFHFFRGAPKLNWMVFYPVERFCSRFTDKLITINQEDYALAKAKFHAGQVCYIPSVGLDLSRFADVQVDRSTKRKEIGVPEDAFLLLSVGELNQNKNHQVVIRALAKLTDPGVHYGIAGMGDQREPLLKLAEELGVSDRVHLLGYRRDVAELYYTADAFCFPSLREGLGMASIEAMACGLPLITSNVHGINDYSMDGVTGFKYMPMDYAGFADGISTILNDRDLRRKMKAHNVEVVQRYKIENVLEVLRRVYE